MKRKCFLNIFSHFCKQTWLEAENKFFVRQVKESKGCQGRSKLWQFHFVCLVFFFFILIERYHTQSWDAWKPQRVFPGKTGHLIAFQKVIVSHGVLMWLRVFGMFNQAETISK